MGVSEECTFFNHSEIARVLQDITICYTMADKEAESVPFININQINFLKRGFRFDDDLQMIVAPLEHDSIEKTLMVHLESDFLSEEEQCISAIQNCLGEYFYYGRDVYQQKLQLLKEVVQECNLQDWVTDKTFMSFEQLCDRHMKGCLMLSDSE